MAASTHAASPHTCPHVAHLMGITCSTTAGGMLRGGKKSSLAWVALPGSWPDASSQALRSRVSSWAPVDLLTLVATWNTPVLKKKKEGKIGCFQFKLVSITLNRLFLYTFI